MASKQSNVDFILEQLADAGDVSARKMFGEFAIYCRGKIVALFCDDQLFVKPTDAGRAFLSKGGGVLEGAPYPGAKPWFLISGDRCEDGEWLSELVRKSERELPPSKPKSPAKSRVKSPANSKAGAPAKPKPKARAKAAPSARAKTKASSRKPPKAAAKKPTRR
jgi:TfoX/Sxy family transcriptional regulator of competence genes